MFDYHSQQMALPASTQKIVTALAGLLQLGRDYQFVTHFETEGKIIDHRLKGDLVVSFTDDPTLSHQQIRNMVAELKQLGIEQVDGDLIIDISAFAGQDKAPGWVWNDMTQCLVLHQAQLLAIKIIDNNCFSATIDSGQTPGDIAHVHTASFYPINMFSQVITLGKGSTDVRYCALDVIPGELNRYS
ncbi:D-alanyl-D-alanine carboxypeptidase DacB [Arsenophonus endosymbiont of Bemisia tabaci Q2]|nr:D-alanyl-D-alanine carboxypeptidase DacB [Arsenophonus endosymbiont of Bemisia tabaci Q2]